MGGETGKRRVRVGRDEVGKVRLVQSVDAEKQHVLVGSSLQIIGLGRRGECPCGEGRGDEKFRNAHLSMSLSLDEG